MNKKAFTLIELLVVVLIIGILSAVALPQYQKAVMKSRYTQAKVMAHAIAEAQEIYYLSNNTYSSSFANLDIDIGGTPPDTNDNTRNFTWGYCTIGAAPYSAATCYHTGCNMGYQVYYTHSENNPGRRYCYTSGNNLSSLQHRICKAETGEETASGGNDEQPYWRYR